MIYITIYCVNLKWVIGIICSLEYFIKDNTDSAGCDSLETGQFFMTKKFEFGQNPNKSHSYSATQLAYNWN